MQTGYRYLFAFTAPAAAAVQAHAVQDVLVAVALLSEDSDISQVLAFQRAAITTEKRPRPVLSHVCSI